MKKKLITTIALILVVASMAVLAVGCKEEKEAPSLEKYIAQISTSKENFKVITTNMTVTDESVTVMTKKKVLTVNGEQADVTVEETVLGEDGNMETTTTTSQTAKADIKTPVNLSADKMIYSKLIDNGFTCIISSDNAAEALGISGATIAGDVTVTCTFDSDKLASVEYELLLETGKQVTVGMTFAY